MTSSCRQTPVRAQSVHPSSPSARYQSCQSNSLTPAPSHPLIARAQTGTRMSIIDHTGPLCAVTPAACRTSAPGHRLKELPLLSAAWNDIEAKPRLSATFIRTRTDCGADVWLNSSSSSV
uniref:Uncharacterized protein n=1 Tax=Knipowitschia caucasica TaxID=637954 RepID=A0AAV2L3C9_KNICA